MKHYEALYLAILFPETVNDIENNRNKKVTVKYLLWGAPNPKTQMILVLPCSCFCPIHRSHVLSSEWRCNWRSTDRRCSNYIWLISNFISYSGPAYIRCLRVLNIWWEFVRREAPREPVSFYWGLQYPTIEQWLFHPAWQCHQCVIIET